MHAAAVFWRDLNCLVCFIFGRLRNDLAAHCLHRQANDVYILTALDGNNRNARIHLYSLRSSVACLVRPDPRSDANDHLSHLMTLCFAQRLTCVFWQVLEWPAPVRNGLGEVDGPSINNIATDPELCYLVALSDKNMVIIWKREESS